jgi:hypothetical protein
VSYNLSTEHPYGKGVTRAIDVALLDAGSSPA